MDPKELAKLLEEKHSTQVAKTAEQQAQANAEHTERQQRAARELCGNLGDDV
jgi:hypothetical protein